MSYRYEKRNDGYWIFDGSKVIAAKADEKFISDFKENNKEKKEAK